MRPKIKLTPEEREIEDSLARGEWETLPDDETEKYRQMAKASIESKNKEKRLNLRLTDEQLDQLKIKATQEGIPYHTLVSSVLHKYLNGTLVERVAFEHAAKRLIASFREEHEKKDERMLKKLAKKTFRSVAESERTRTLAKYKRK